MVQNKSAKPLKQGSDPHRSFQCLETVYVPKELASNISIGDLVFWDIKNEQLNINNKAKVKLYIRNRKYYNCIDFDRHNVISWVAAKEGRKIKIFTTVDLKNPYGKTLEPTESESIKRNIDIILPQLQNGIGKGFWQSFDSEDRQIPNSINQLLLEVANVKILAEDIFLLDSLTEREIKISEILDKIRQINSQEIPKIKDELLPSSDFKIENIEEYWTNRLSHNTWNALNSNVKRYLETGELVYRFLDTVNIPDLDWTSANVEFCKAVELELQQKIFKSFGKWLLKRDGTLSALFSSFDWEGDKYMWYNFIRNAKNNKDTEITLGSINWVFKNLKELQNDRAKLTRFEKELLFNFDEFISGIEQRHRDFLLNLPKVLNEIIKTRNGSLHTKFLERKKVDTFKTRLETIFKHLQFSDI